MVRIVLHKKLIASSLTEVITATTILLLVFAIALVTLSNIMNGTLRKDNRQMKTKLSRLIYDYRNQKIKIPYNSKEDDYKITIYKLEENTYNFIEFSIVNERTNKEFTKQILAEDEKSEN